MEAFLSEDEDLEAGFDDHFGGMGYDDMMVRLADYRCRERGSSEGRRGEKGWGERARGTESEGGGGKSRCF